MPVKIKHKQLKKTQWVDYENYFHNYMNNDLYETLAIKDVYELYNRISDVELWQTTLEKEAAETALKKHPEIFRIEYSDKNTKLKANTNVKSKEIIHEISLNDISIINAHRANQLRDAGLLDKNLPIKIPTITDIKTHIETHPKGTSFRKILKSDIMLYFVYPLLAIIAGCIIWFFILPTLTKHFPEYKIK